MIADGRIAIDGKLLDTPATLVKSLNGVTVDGRPVKAPAPARLFIYHKPAGLLVTERDPKGRPTIYDKLPKDLPRLMPVGRLDLNTEGLLLLTTDGGLKRQLELPSTGVERVYRARAYGEVSQVQLEDLIEGVEIDGVRYGQIDANLERRTGANVWIELRLAEGKNREVRRVLEHLGLKVSRLIRLAYGPFVLGELPPGEIGEIRQHDLVTFRKSLSGGRREGERPVAGQAPRTRRPARDGEATEKRGAKPPRPRSKSQRPRSTDAIPDAKSPAGKKKPATGNRTAKNNAPAREKPAARMDAPAKPRARPRKPGGGRPK
ncbi:pseudouridine synthase [Stakelama sp. CBK3Z-3]|uniref:Pseudouridine synthase n=1 Tax=Stakelama flava TaxID=2860338 RepID=A0ABS6XGT0_9SPHN|nr:pseudouridine synthase [Stakelama flava]